MCVRETILTYSSFPSSLEIFTLATYYNGILRLLFRDFLVVQWLRLHLSTHGGVGLISGQRTKVPHALGCGQKITNFLYIVLPMG